MGDKLVYHVLGERREAPLVGDAFTIGRQAGRNLVLDDRSVSRQHARLDRAGDAWTIMDTKSVNGVQINGKPIHGNQSVGVNDGDVLTLGIFKLEFIRDDGEKLVIREGPSAQTFTRPVAIFQDLIREPPTDHGSIAAEELRRARRAVRVAAEVGRVIASSRPLQEIMESIVKLVFEATTAERGALLLWDPVAGELVPKVVRQRSGNTDRFEVSRSLVTRAFDERCAVKLDRGNSGHTFVSRSLLSAVAVPLWEQQQVKGVIYADSSSLIDAFDEASIDLLSALANSATMALEQSQLQRRIRRGERDKERLGRYLPPEIVDRIVSLEDTSNEIDLTAQEADVTILFCDMVGFTTRAETLEPAMVMSMLNRYFGRMSDVIFEHQGTLDKFIGDCLMAAFGAPLPQADHAARAARAALGLRAAVRELNAVSGEPLGFRIGLNSGAAVAGDVGNARRREWTVIGSTVNLASRTEGMAQTDQILLTEFTRPLLGPEFELQSVGARRPKGLSRDIEMFELVGLSDQPTPRV